MVIVCLKGWSTLEIVQVFLDPLDGTNSMKQMLHHVTYIEERHFLKKAMLSCVLLQSVYN